MSGALGYREVGELERCDRCGHAAKDHREPGAEEREPIGRRWACWARWGDRKRCPCDGFVPKPSEREGEAR